MCTASTAKRRRRQARNSYAHMAKLGRPIYKKKSASKSARQLRKVIAGERLRQQRSKK